MGHGSEQQADSGCVPYGHAFVPAASGPHSCAPSSPCVGVRQPGLALHGDGHFGIMATIPPQCPAVSDPSRTAAQRPLLRSSASPYMPSTPQAGTAASVDARALDIALAWQPAARDGRGLFAEVVECVRRTLEACEYVACAQSAHGYKGWTLTAYVQPEALKTYRGQLYSLTQQAFLIAVDRSGRTFVIGYAASPFSPLPLGFGLTLADMPSRDTACWSSYAGGFCERPGACRGEHPTCRVGVHVMLKPARADRG